MTLAVVRFAAYRGYERHRTDANNAMMALLAGSRLAAHTLTLTEGSPHRLGEIFPNVDHIRRLNLRTEIARTLLHTAEDHLGVMAVPYALALHEDLVTTSLAMLAAAGVVSGSAIAGRRSADMHESVAAITHVRLNTDSLALFHLMRLARNAHVHGGGKAEQVLADHRAHLRPQALQVWRQITGTPAPAYRPGERVRLGLAELVGVLAVTKRLARQVNEALQQAIPAPRWAEIAWEDWIASRPLPGNPQQRFHTFKGYTRLHYGNLGLSDELLHETFARAG